MTIFVKFKKNIFFIYFPIISIIILILINLILVIILIIILITQFLYFHYNYLISLLAQYGRIIKNFLIFFSHQLTTILQVHTFQAIFLSLISYVISPNPIQNHVILFFFHGNVIKISRFLYQQLIIYQYNSCAIIPYLLFWSTYHLQ